MVPNHAYLWTWIRLCFFYFPFFIFARLLFLYAQVNACSNIYLWFSFIFGTRTCENMLYENSYLLLLCVCVFVRLKCVQNDNKIVRNEGIPWNSLPCSEFSFGISVSSQSKFEVLSTFGFFFCTFYDSSVFFFLQKQMNRQKWTAAEKKAAMIYRTQ